MAMNAHWHQCSWEVDQGSPADWNTSVARRPRVMPGQVSVIPTPGDDAREWHRDGVGAYIEHSSTGKYVFARVVWRCTGECPKQ